MGKEDKSAFKVTRSKEKNERIPNDQSRALPTTGDERLEIVDRDKGSSSGSVEKTNESSRPVKAVSAFGPLLWILLPLLALIIWQIFAGG
ncbi:MAG: hypothetical protein JXA30_15000 [Deltaproteobacteria bacterium]|nr:hypothetical protein [Deltaproteobacteria bacterium]